MFILLMPSRSSICKTIRILTYLNNHHDNRECQRGYDHHCDCPLWADVPTWALAGKLGYAEVGGTVWECAVQHTHCQVKMHFTLKKYQGLLIEVNQYGTMW